LAARWSSSQNVGFHSDKNQFCWEMLLRMEKEYLLWKIISCDEDGI
jgi:hypothetical protein